MALVERYFTAPGEYAEDCLEWETDYVRLEDGKGNIIYEQSDVEFPKFWSSTARQIVASKYFYGEGESRERSLCDLVGRVVEKIGYEGMQAVNVVISKKN
jgi:ribonucleoside-diphosphate reductase alpha chain